MVDHLHEHRSITGLLKLSGDEPAAGAHTLFGIDRHDGKHLRIQCVLDRDGILSLRRLVDGGSLIGCQRVPEQLERLLNASHIGNQRLSFDANNVHVIRWGILCQNG